MRPDGGDTLGGDTPGGDTLGGELGDAADAGLGPAIGWAALRHRPG
ncbi:MAG: hypothetical protein U5L06_07120 [Rhodovibrio sp.]|nr:hypothetical protein [Rhodovibrio sp.]